jgi:deazaflavin-dependent oxidoreductase (nitroreductase family)
MAVRLSAQAEARLRQLFKCLNFLMRLLWRLGLGGWMNAWPDAGGQIMIVVHTGRKTGRRRYTPVNYARVDGEIYCTAGFGAVADWYRNLQVNPAVEVWLPEAGWTGVAEDISDDPARLTLMRQVLIGSGFAARLFGINPQTISDPALDEVTKSYRLIRIRRGVRVRGTRGPGDLAWVWPVAAAALLGWVLLCRKRA